VNKKINEKDSQSRLEARVGHRRVKIRGLNGRFGSGLSRLSQANFDFRQAAPPVRVNDTELQTRLGNFDPV
jgi:hypothetical protein